jgi:hypothetical protein
MIAGREIPIEPLTLCFADQRLIRPELKPA